MDSPDFSLSKQPEINEISGNDLVGKIMHAHTLQRLGNISQAVEIYKEVIALDPNGACGRSALEAVNEINNESKALNLLPHAPYPENTPYIENKQKNRNRKNNPLFIKWFLDLSISKKYLLVIIFSEFLFLLLTAIGSQLLARGIKLQLLNQAKSELAVLEINYNIKIDQMVVGFQAQADNAAIINLANTPAQVRNSIGYFQLQSQVKQILQNQLKTLKIEYSTLVGKDLRIIASANVQRQGEIFNPNNLVAEVLSDPRQIKASEIVSSAELALEGSQVPFDFANQDALIRYTVTPVRDPVTLAVIGALVSGDIVNGKLLIPQETVKAFGEGYSAVYLREPGGEFALATAFAKTNASDPPRRNDPLPNSSLIAAAAAANGEPVTSEALINGQTYALAAKSLPITFKKVANGWLPGYSANPVAILVRGTPERAITALVGDSLNKLAFSSVVLISASVLLSLQLGRLITKPIKHLREITKNFSQGDRTARAEVETTDEVGQLAIAFNQMADNILTSEVALRKHDLSEIRLIEQARLQEIQAQSQRELREKQAQKIIDFLLEIEGTKSGNLTIQADVGADEIGAIADAFNATIINFRSLVLQVQSLANEIDALAQNSESYLLQSSTATSEQELKITQVKEVVEEIRDANSIGFQSVQSAAIVARQALAVWQQTDTSINQSLVGIDKIKTVIRNTVKRANCLDDSLQKILLTIQNVSKISERINILALNASIEAIKADDNDSESLSLIADEIRGAAQQLVNLTKSIESLFISTEKQSLEILRIVETGKNELDSELYLLETSQPKVQELAEMTRKIVLHLDKSSETIPSEIDVYAKIDGVLEDVIATSQADCDDIQKRIEASRTLLNRAQKLQEIVSKFKV